MNADRINYLNIGLMAVSAVAAFVLPFEAFLFSYAVLGPLHYLTEISWLHEKRYFTKHRNDYLLLGGLAVALLGLALTTKAMLKAMGAFVPSPATQEYAKDLQTWATPLMYVAFASALAMIFLKRPLYRAFALLFILITAIFLRTLGSAQLFFSIFLPTLVHVFLFTGAFILYGALKSRSKSGMLSFGAFLLMPILLYVFNRADVGIPLSKTVLHTYDGFAGLNAAVIQLFHLGESSSREQIYYSSYGLLIMRFIAYAYTYHYLNWFSKTSIIKWHRVPKLRLAIVGVLWAGAVSLYWFSYEIGVMALYCLSFMHVFLEFPLNHLTFVGIGTEARRWGKDWLASEKMVGTNPAPRGEASALSRTAATE